MLQESVNTGLALFSSVLEMSQYIKGTSKTKAQTIYKEGAVTSNSGVVVCSE